LKIKPKFIVLVGATLANALLIYRYFSTLVTEGERSANGFGAIFLIIFLVIFNLTLFLIFFVKKTPLIKSGMFVAVLPILCAFLYSLINGGSMFNEDSGGGAYLWLLIITFPIGTLLILISLIVNLIKRFNT
jgi:hypothetical protein